MKQWSKSIPALCILLTGLLFANRVDAQCSVKLVSGSTGCAPYNAQFERTDTATNKTVVSVVWNYTGGSASSTKTFYSINLKNPGSYTVSITVTYSDGSHCTSDVPQTIIVYATPTAKINLPTDPNNGPIQCFKKNGILNNFTFTESSHPGSSGAPIVSYYWNFGDGQVSTQHNPKHSYQAGGTYNISLRVVDSNGCEGYDTIVAKIKVLKDIGTSFTNKLDQQCNVGKVQFVDITDTVGLGLKSWLWDFGDGTTDGSIYNPTHTYGPGKYLVSLTITNSLGCTATDTQTIVVKKFEIKIFFKDTVCWTDAHNKGITFSAEEQPSADLWTWNFDDPNSGPPDVINFEWTQNHKFAGGPLAGGAPSTAYVAGGGGPGIYDVSFTMHDPTCGTLDTCFYVHVLGPMAYITPLLNPPPLGPFPLNDTVPPTLVPKSDFLAINANHSSCDVDTLQYVTYKKLQNPPGANHWTYKFCNADTVKINGKPDLYTNLMVDCYYNPPPSKPDPRTIPYVYGLTLKPTDSTNHVYRDSVPVYHTWHKGDPIPSYLSSAPKIYYPAGGHLNFNDMSDTNLITCKLPNLVRFTNNSVKWRLHYAIDDNTWQNVIDPAHSFRDTCKWKNWPMASDSLIYYWSFNDPSGKKCTNTSNKKVPIYKNGIIWVDSIGINVFDPGCLCTHKVYKKDTVTNWDCNFATVAAPYHYYKGINGLPATGCQSVILSAFDPVTKCKDSITQILKQGPPVAGWNKLAYCKMTWEMQETGLAPKGTPGPSGPPLIGFMLTGQANPCAGFEYPFGIDFEQTIPTCAAEHWWAVFDSANVTKYKHCPNGDSVLDYGFTGDLGPGYSPALNGYPSGAPDKFWQGIPWFTRYWWNVGDTGCKTIGIVLQVGNCFDTAWYHDYICFNKLNAYFDIFQVVRPDTGSKSQANPYYGIGAGGGPTIPGDSGVGYTQVFVDSSESGVGRVCQPPALNPFGATGKDIVEGVRLYFFPRDTNQSDVSTFKYNITRNGFFDNPAYNNPLASWYYNYAPHGTPVGFWPDSASLNPFTNVSDSVAQIKEHINFIDTPHIYIIVPPTAANVGLPAKRILLNFPIYGTDTTGELDSLITRDSVAISINDRRARFITVNCDKKYIEVYTDPGFKVVGQSQILRLGGFKAVDSFIKTPTTIPDTGVFASGPQMTLPYPGFYTINAVATNLEGCQQSSTYFLIYGHYATFWVNDSVICLGAPTIVHWYVRYWSHNCPPKPPLGIIPDGCLNGAMEGIDGLGNNVDFNPWDSLSPTSYRNQLTAANVPPLHKWNQIPHPGYQPESVALNFGEPGDTIFHFVPNVSTKGVPATSDPHIYKKPGVYTITMKTTDWRGCSVYTRRQNLMKVIAVKAKFGLLKPSDTLTYCPPKLISFYDSSTIAGNKYTEKVVSNGQIVDSTYIVDSILDRIWTPGDGKTITRTGFESLFQYDYINADTLFDVGLTIITANSVTHCNNQLIRPRFLRIIGPAPRFELIGNSAGCYPFKAQTHITSHDKNASQWTWNFGDWPTKPKDPHSLPSDLDSETLSATPPYDTTGYLAYSKDTGRFRLTLSETDTFTDVTGVKQPPCTITWPDSDSVRQFFITVYPNSPITITGDTTICSGTPAFYIVNSKYHEYNKHYSWWMSPNGPIPDSVETKHGDSLNVILFRRNDWLAARTIGDTDNLGNALYTIHVRAESDTGPVPPDTSGCFKTGTLTVHVQGSYADFGIDSSQQNMAKFTFHDSSKNARNYVLKFGDGDSTNTLQKGWTASHTYSNLGNNNVPEGFGQPVTQFRVTLKTVSPYGCRDSISKWVTILREYQHYNVFTPNSDDTINSRFSLFIKGQISSSLKIYNRWGNMVFQNKGSNSDTSWTKDPANTWDGNDQVSGQPCPPGTYYYVWQFELVGGEKKTINGAVTLIR